MRVCWLALALLSALAAAAPTTTITFCHGNGRGASVLVQPTLELADNTTIVSGAGFIGYGACQALNVDYNGLQDYRTILRVTDQLGDQLIFVYFTPPSETDATQNVAFFVSTSETYASGSAVTWRVSVRNTAGPARVAGESIAAFATYVTSTTADVAYEFWPDSSGAIATGVLFTAGALANVTVPPALNWTVRASAAPSAVVAFLSTSAAPASLSQKTFFLALVGNVGEEGSNLMLIAVGLPLEGTQPSLTLCAFNSADTAVLSIDVHASGSETSGTPLATAEVSYRACENVSPSVPSGAMRSGISIVVRELPSVALTVNPATVDPSRNVFIAVSGADLPSGASWALVAPTLLANPTIASTNARVVFVHAGIGAGDVVGIIDSVSTSVLQFSESSGRDLAPGAAIVVRATKNSDASVIAQATLSADVLTAESTVVAVLSGSSSAGYTVGAAGSTTTTTSTTSAASALEIPLRAVLAAAALAIMFASLVL